MSWQWSGGRPGGEAVEVAKEGEVKVQSKKGNTIKKNAEPNNPAVHISRSGNDVVKKASELDVDESKGGKSDDKEDKDDEKKENGDAKAGDKRTAADKKDDEADEEADEDADEKPAKKQKKGAKAKENGDKEGDKKKPGRPKKDTAASKPKKEPKKAATESGAPRRSGRNK